MISVVSYPERGEGGRNSYRGNCSPKLIEDLVRQFGWSSLSDYMCGSGTTADVCIRLNIESHCYDLNRGFDLLSMDIPERNQAIFWHPPYGDMIVYSGEQYDDEEVQRKYGFDPKLNDLSRIHDWDEFVKAMNYCMMKQFATLETGGRMAVLMGDMKRKGRCYSMLTDIVKPGTLENIVIKMQHNCLSSKNSYSGRFIPIVHEYLMIVRKDMPVMVDIQLPQRYKVDIRDMETATWRDALCDVMRGKGSLSLADIYSKFEGHKKAQKNPTWQATIRRTLQQNPGIFHSPERGIWRAA